MEAALSLTIKEYFAWSQAPEKKILSKKGMMLMIYCRGIRGATTVENNTKEEILAATTELLQLIVERNNLRVEDIVSALFSVTHDLDAAFPARAARLMGWTDAALMCTREIPVPGSLEKCIRVLLHINTTRTAAEMRHAYIKGAANLRDSDP